MCACSQEPLSIEVKSEALDRRTDDFTNELTKYLQEHFLEFARSKAVCEQGKIVEELVRKWAYMVRFADWSYHEGVMHFVLFSKDAFSNMHLYVSNDVRSSLSVRVVKNRSFLFGDSHKVLCGYR